MLASTGEGDWQGAVDIAGNIDTYRSYYENQQQVFIDSGRITDPVPVDNYVLFDVMADGYAAYPASK